MTGITRDEWLRALDEAGVRSRADDQDALTQYEYADMMGLPVATARGHLKALVRVGKAIETTKRQQNSYGRLITYKAYRLRG